MYIRRLLVEAAAGKPSFHIQSTTFFCEIFPFLKLDQLKLILKGETFCTPEKKIPLNLRAS